jgi:hypothetical protein
MPGGPKAEGAKPENYNKFPKAHRGTNLSLQSTPRRACVAEAAALARVNACIMGRSFAHIKSNAERAPTLAHVPKSQQDTHFQAHAHMKNVSESAGQKRSSRIMLGSR